MSEQRHRIRRQVLEIAVQDQSAAWQISSELGRIQRESLEAIVDRCCTEAGDPDRLHRIESLEVDLGRIDPADLERDLVEKLGPRLRAALSARIRAEDEATSLLGVDPETTSRLELVAFFARTGNLPWWADASRPRLLSETVAALLQRAARPLAALVRTLARDLRELRRLVRHCDEEQLSALFTALVAAAPRGLAQRPAELRALLLPRRAIAGVLPDAFRNAVRVAALRAISVEEGGGADAVSFWRGALAHTALELGVTYTFLITRLHEARERSVADRPDAVEAIVQSLYREMRGDAVAGDSAHRESGAKGETAALPVQGRHQGVRGAAAASLAAEVLGEARRLLRGAIEEQGAGGRADDGDEPGADRDVPADSDDPAADSDIPANNDTPVDSDALAADSDALAADRDIPAGSDIPENNDAPAADRDTPADSDIPAPNGAPASVRERSLDSNIPEADSGSATDSDVPETESDLRAAESDTLAADNDIPTIDGGTPATDSDAPWADSESPATGNGGPATDGDIPDAGSAERTAGIATETAAAKEAADTAERRAGIARQADTAERAAGAAVEADTAERTTAERTAGIATEAAAAKDAAATAQQSASTAEPAPHTAEPAPHSADELESLLDRLARSGLPLQTLFSDLRAATRPAAARRPAAAGRPAPRPGPPSHLPPSVVEALKDLEQQARTHGPTAPETAGSVLRLLRNLTASRQLPPHALQRALEELERAAAASPPLQARSETQRLLRRASAAAASENNAALPPLDLAYADSEDVYVENAGLVLLWPFLGHLFERLELMTDRRFKDRSALHRAVGLLQYLLTEDPTPPEYQVLLPRVLCGMDMKEAFDFGPPVTEAEAEECSSLLAAVIANAPVLKEMSIPGFRGSFLLRKGMLGSRDGAWLLRVERVAYDVVLDRFPWGTSWVKLPWMDAPLSVEW